MTGICKWSKDTRKANTYSASLKDRHDVNPYAYQFIFFNLYYCKQNTRNLYNQEKFREVDKFS